MSSSPARLEDHHCTRCGRRTSAKRLTDLGEVGALCAKCFDAIPFGMRRTMLRRVGARR